MFGSILKKKLSYDKLANVFINGIVDSTRNGFPVVAELINEDPAFVKCPNVDSSNHHEFTLILLIGNLTCIESSFDPEDTVELERAIYEKLAKIYGMSVYELKQLVRDYKHLMSRLNHPSKNVIYAMSKCIFDKYALYNFQDEYFRRMQSPNPLFLKRLDEVVQCFIWDWDAFFKKYKLNA